LLVIITSRTERLDLKKALYSLKQIAFELHIRCWNYCRHLYRASLLPQLIKIIREKQVEDLSAGMSITLMVG
jgi:hypothetical protein